MLLRLGVIMYQTSYTKGQELVAERMVKEFRRQGHDAFLITSVYHDGEPVVPAETVKQRGGYLHLFDRKLGIPVIRMDGISPTWPPRRISLLDFMALLERVVEELDINVLITHSTLWNGPEEVAKFVDWRRRLVSSGALKHEVIFCHMSHFQEPSDESYSATERTYREAWNEVSLRSVLEQSELVLVTTPQEGDMMCEMGALRNKIVLFPGGIDLETDFIEGTSAPLQNLNIKPDAKIVTVLGTVEERKNVLSVLEVARRLSDRTDVHLVIAGGLDGEYGQIVKREAQSLGNVSVLGPISDEMKLALLRSSYLNLTMSRSEALGLVQLESMHVGVPVVSSGVGGQAWIVKNGENGIVLDGPNDVAGAVAAISLLLEKNSYREKLSRKAQESVRKFTMPELVQKLERRLLHIAQKWEDDDRLLRGLAPEEHAIQTWVGEGRKVTATNRRLIVKQLRGGRKIIAIPYQEISHISKKSRLSKKVTAAMASLASLICAAWLLRAYKSGTVASWAYSSFPWLPRLDYSTILAPALVLPVLVLSAAAILVTIRRGYMIHRSCGAPIFVQQRFLQALHIASKFAKTSLFDESDQIGQS